MSSPKGQKDTEKVEPPVVNGWTLLVHPALVEQLDALEVTAAGKGKPAQGAAKVLKWLLEAMFEEVPGDPTRAIYRQGGTLGPYTSWFRVKYAGRFRLFFRFDSASKTIVYGWVNDSETLRTYGKKTDAYSVFRGKLDDGHPPDNWDSLKKEAAAPSIIKRLLSFRPKRS